MPRTIIDGTFVREERRTSRPRQGEAREVFRLTFRRAGGTVRAQVDVDLTVAAKYG